MELTTAQSKAETVQSKAETVNSKLEAMKLKFWSKKKSFRVTNSDPEYKVHYLGNVLTTWAKGEGSIDKPLATLLKNYRSNVSMNLTICNSGLKATTRQHGLTEYWANRITYAATHPAHPKIFCWIYRHEGRRMKQELRCHAVLCSKDSKAKEMAELLNARLVSALQEFRREKRYRQNARLSLASSCQDIPLRKQMLIKGYANFRQPLERSKSAPRLTSILETMDEEEEEEEEEEEQLDEDSQSVIAYNEQPEIHQSIFNAVDIQVTFKYTVNLFSFLNCCV